MKCEFEGCNISTSISEGTYCTKHWRLPGSVPKKQYKNHKAKLKQELKDMLAGQWYIDKLVETLKEYLDLQEDEEDE